MKVDIELQDLRQLMPLLSSVAYGKSVKTPVVLSLLDLTWKRCVLRVRGSKALLQYSQSLAR
jgi:hypothetical protein